MFNNINTSSIEMLNKIFPIQSELIEYLILEYMFKNSEPVGSWTLKTMLDDLGISVGSATIGRYLKMLDNQGYTEQVANKGRVLTDIGLLKAEHLHIQVAESHLSASIIEAARPNDLDELIEVLRARRAIEHEAAKLAALRATTEDLKEISWALSQHRQVVIRGLDPSGAGLDFHITVANASKNHFMSSMIKLLTYEERFIEQRIEVLSTLELASENVDMHEQILQALINRDSELASKLMEDHLQHLIDLVQLDSTNFPDKIVKNKRVSST